MTTESDNPNIMGDNGGAGGGDAAPAPVVIGGVSYTPEQLQEALQANQKLSRMEQVVQGLQETLEKRLSAADLLKQGNASQQPATPPPAKPEDVVKLVMEELNKKSTETQQETNLGTFRAALSNAYGKDAEAKGKELAQQLNMSVPDMLNLAKTHPALLTKFVPVPDQKNTVNTLTNVKGGMPVRASESDTSTSGSEKPSIMGRTTKERVAAWQAALADYVNKK